MTAMREDWLARTGDGAFVDKVLGAVARLRPSIEAAALAGQAVDEATVPGVTALAASLRQVGATCRKQAAPLAQEAAEPLLAKADLVDEIVSALDDLASPDAGTVMNQYAVSIAAELDRAASGFGADADLEGAATLVDELLDALSALDATERQRLLAAKWPPATVAAMAGRLAGVAQFTLIHDAVAAAGDDTDYVGRLASTIVTEAVDAAVDADGVLAPGSIASAVLAVVGTSRAAESYMSSMEARWDALLFRTIPAFLSRPIAALHGAASLRFGGVTAAALAKGGLLLRLIAPAVDEQVGNALQAADPELTEMLDEYVAQVVAAGGVAAAISDGGEDPDDVLTQRGAALASPGALERCFAEPTPDDPLGTLPRVTVNALGAALLLARTKRTTDYDWLALTELEDANADDYLLLLEDERMAVMDLILLTPQVGMST